MWRRIPGPLPAYATMGGAWGRGYLPPFASHLAISCLESGVRTVCFVFPSYIRHLHCMINDYYLPCVYMFIHVCRDLFPPHSKFIQIFVTGTCKFMQVHAIIMLAYYCYFFCSLSREFSANPRRSTTSLPSLGPEYSSFTTFGLVRAFVRRWHPLAKDRLQQQHVCQRMPPLDEGSDRAEMS